MRTVSDRPESATKRQAIADLARIAAAIAEVLTIVDDLHGQIEPVSTEQWKARIADIPNPAKRSIIKRWVVHALDNGRDPAARDQNAVREFLRYKHGTNEPYAENTHATYSTYLNEWFDQMQQATN